MDLKKYKQLLLGNEHSIIILLSFFGKFPSPECISVNDKQARKRFAMT